MLEPQSQAIFDAKAAAGGGGIADVELSLIRELVAEGRSAFPQTPAMASVRDEYLPSGVRVRVYEPETVTSGSAPIVYLHGGGWVLCDIEDFDPLCRELAYSSEAIVVGVGYRLAPEHPFPAPLDDAWEAVRWVAREISPDSAVILAGDSAGANLAAVCARRARDAGDPHVVAQILAYPMLDHRLDRESHSLYGTGYSLSTADLAWYWDQYLSDATARDLPDASPLRADDFTGLAPAFLLLASHDPLLDEGKAYAEALRAHGVDATVVVQPGVMHGFLSMVGILDASALGLSSIAGFLADLHVTTDSESTMS